jgi:hypothetical protein
MRVCEGFSKIGRLFEFVCSGIEAFLNDVRLFKKTEAF